MSGPVQETTAPAPLPDWASDPETLERIFMAAVGQGDAEGVDAALRLMLVCDPRRAIDLYHGLEMALIVAKAGAS